MPTPSDASGSTLRPLPHSIVVSRGTQLALDAIENDDERLDNEAISTRILGSINQEIAVQNAIIENSSMREARRSYVSDLDHNAIALTMFRLHPVVNIVPSVGFRDSDLNLLAIYDDNPESDSYGTYLTSSGDIRRIIRRYNYGITSRGVEEVMAALSDYAPRVTRTTDPNLVPVKNGVFRRSDKSLIDFSPDMVFISKTNTAYVEDAPLPVYVDDAGDSWDPESWIKSLTDDAGVPELLWQVIGAVCRPYESWNKSAWFYSERGNNGKGTLLELMRHLIGEGNHTSIPISAFGQEFMLETLTRAGAILVDENDVGTYIDKAANLKAVITNDVIMINRKHKAPVAFQFYGFMVQCLNEFPRIRDRSESFYRRQLFIPFTKSFTGAEKRHIKDDYIKREEVLQYVLHRVLHMDYTEFDEPAAVIGVLDEYKEHNDPIRAFWSDVREEFTWNMLPLSFLYDLYKAWLQRNSPSATPVSHINFNRDLRGIVANDDMWVDMGAHRLRHAGRMSGAEPLINDYDLPAPWSDPSASRTNPTNRATPKTLKEKYTALIRRGHESAGGA